MNGKSKQKIQLIESINSNATTTTKLLEPAGTNLELAFIRIYNIQKKSVLDILNMKQIVSEFEMNRKKLNR